MKEESEIKPYPLCFGNIFKNFTVDNLKKTSVSDMSTIFLLIIIQMVPEIL